MHRSCLCCQWQPQFFRTCMTWQTASEEQCLFRHSSSMKPTYLQKKQRKQQRHRHFTACWQQRFMSNQWWMFLEKWTSMQIYFEAVVGYNGNIASLRKMIDSPSGKAECIQFRTTSGEEGKFHPPSFLNNSHTSTANIITMITYRYYGCKVSSQWSCPLITISRIRFGAVVFSKASFLQPPLSQPRSLKAEAPVPTSC